MMNKYFVEAAYEESKKYFYTNPGWEVIRDFSMMYACMSI